MKIICFDEERDLATVASTLDQAYDEMLDLNDDTRPATEYRFFEATEIAVEVKIQKKEIIQKVRTK